MKQYTVNEIFFSLQGEGVRAGTPNLFVRFTGCNLTCRKETHGFDCDTEFTSGRKLTGIEILKECQRIASNCRSVIFTGGEPLLQLDNDLLDIFGAAGFYKAVETNGSIPILVATIQWITLSPKVAEHTIKLLTCSEIKYVRHYGQGIPVTKVNADHYLISPAFADHEIEQDTLKWCINLVKENPKWRLSVQQHKSWGVR